MLKYFRFWLRFRGVIGILGFKKTDSPGNDTLVILTRRGRGMKPQGVMFWRILLTRQGMILPGDLTHRGIKPRGDWGDILAGVSYPRTIESFE